MTKQPEPTGLPRELAERQTDLYRRVVGLHHELSMTEVAARAGLDLPVVARFFRAFGLPEMEPEAKGFDDQDVETLAAIRLLLEAGIAEDDVLAVARVYGQAFSRIADAEQRVFRKRFLDPMIRHGMAPEQMESLEPLSRQLNSLLDAPLRNAHRRQLDIAIRQLVISATTMGTERHAVGFVDLVDYSQLVATLEGDELSRLISRFDALAVERCTAVEARVVKLVGDAVLFVSHDAGPALEAARAIVEGAARDDVLPSARAGLDFGEVLPLEGDYFGTPVNIAARIVSVARPGAVVASHAFGQALGESRAGFLALGPHELKGVGAIELLEIEPGPVNG